MSEKRPSDADFDCFIKTNVREILIECRHEKGLTQTDVGNIVGKSKTAVASWEQGLALPDIPTLYKLALYYRKSLEYMCGLEKEGEENDH